MKACPLKKFRELSWGATIVLALLCPFTLLITIPSMLACRSRKRNEGE